MRRLRLWLAVLLLATVGMSCARRATPTAVPRPPTRTPLPPTPEPPSSAAAHYYVDSQRGHDDNPGTSPDRPWQSLSRLSQQALRPGDVVGLAGDSVWDGGLVISQSGEPGRPLIFQAYGTGDAPTVRNPGAHTGALVIEGSWVVVRGLRVRDAHEYGIEIARGASHNVVENCEATAVGMGFAVFGDHNLIQGCYAHDLHMILDTPGGDDDYGAVGVGIFGSHNEIAHNQIERCLSASHDYGFDGGAFELFGDVTGNFIHHNWARDNRGFVEVGGGSAHDNLLAYNVSVNNGSFATLHLGGRFASDVTRLYVDNNTIVETGSGSEILIFIGETNSEALLLRNNIICVGSYRQVANSAHFTHTHNLYYLRQRLTRLGFGLGPGEQTGDPLFVDPDGQDFRLQPGSPATSGATALTYHESFRSPPAFYTSPTYLGALPPVGD